jgi:hypothetical protein
MNSQPLNRPYVGITLTTDDYAKVKGLLPTPSYTDILYSRTAHKTTLLYMIDGFITSSKQYKWLSDIKLGLKEFLIVEYEDVEEFYISDDTEGTGVLYSLQELHNAFNIKYRDYPSIYYAPTKKRLYRHLVIHGKKLRHQQLFTMEAMTSAALMMNSILKDKLQTKDLHKKVKGAYKFILENQDNFRERLSVSELKDAHKRGAVVTHKKRSFNTETKIFEALSTGNYVKRDGSINKTLLANDLDMNRKTIAKYLKSIAV